MKYWLVKTEPESFSIQDLARQPKRTTHWHGVRNYQARNTLRDDMKLGEQVLFYHSNAEPPCVVGIAEVVREGYGDFTAWDQNSEYFDPKSTVQNPRWFMVDLKLVRIFAQPLALETLRPIAALQEMELLRKGSRLSVQPVRKKEFDAIVKLAGN